MRIATSSPGAGRLEHLLQALSELLEGNPEPIMERTLDSVPASRSSGSARREATADPSDASAPPQTSLLQLLQRRVSTLHERIGRLQRMLDHKSQRLDLLEGDVSAVERLQGELAPKAMPSFPGLRLHAFSRSADRICGDFMDVSKTGGGRLLISLSDVTGHGSVAGQLGLLVRSALRCARGMGRDPRRSLLRLNRDLLSLELSEHPFVAALTAVIEPESSSIRWARCGTPFPLLIRPGKPVETLESRGTLLGCIAKPECEVREHPLAPGDALLFATDGLENLLSPERPTAWRQTPWCAGLGKRPIAESLAEVANMADAPERSFPLRDDVSILAVERL